MTAQTSLYFSKLGLKGLQQINESKGPEVCFIHNIVVHPTPYRGRESLNQIGKQKIEDQQFVYTNPKTSFYLCKKYKHSTEWQKNQRFLMKRLAYRKTNTVDRWGRIIYNDSETKNYDQVATEFHSLNLLKESHRSIQLISLIHENTRSKEDKRFFYSNLKLPDRRSKDIKNVCFILEEMSDGSLREQIDKINITKEPFSEQKIIEFSCQFAEGLLELKEKGIIHRDLRPQNVLIHNGQIKFGDFDSAFIKGYSDYRNIKNGVDMKETTPLEIMLLIAESDQNLMRLSSEELYKKQQKADIYFLGVNIYTMVFSQLFQSFNGGKVLNNLISIKKRSGFCSKLLNLMARCLEKDVHVRIGLEETIKILSEIERQFYFKSSSYKRIYLGPEPLNLYSFSSSQNEYQIESEYHILSSENVNKRSEMDKLLDQVIKVGTIERNTSMYERLFKKNIEAIEIDEIWVNSQRNKLVQLNQEMLMTKIQNFLQRLKIKAYYYELAYRILFQVNLVNVNSAIHFQNIRSHIELFSSQLVVILSFIYGTIIKFSFTSDPYYDQLNNSYEIRKTTENIKNLHSRWQFFTGRQNLQLKANNTKKQMRQQLNEMRETGNHNKKDLELIEEAFKFSIEGINIVESLVRMIEDLNSKTYDKEKERFSFQTQERYIMKYLDKMEAIVKKQMIQTIISLILAYQKIKTEPWGHLSNLKNAIFMLMILQAQNTKDVQKNDMVIIKEELATMINMHLGWKSQELEAFFNNYTHTHTEEVIKGLCELESQAIITTEQNEKEEDICIQINGFHTEKSDRLATKNTPKSEVKMEEDLDKPEEGKKDKEDPKDPKQQQERLKESIVEGKPTEESRMKETFDYQLSEGELKNTVKESKKDQKIPEPGVILVEYYD